MKKNLHTRASKEEGTLTSGFNLSFWTESTDPIRLSPLIEDLQTETVVVGGGISGLSVAYNLAKAGKQVVVLEDGFIGSGETGRTTAHITNALDDRYSVIGKKLGEDNAKLAAESHTAAIEFIRRVVESENIDCDFQLLDGYLFLHPSDDKQSLLDELDATQRAGIQTELIDNFDSPANIPSPVLKFPHQAQFHPLKYLKGLTDAILKYGGKIFTESHVSSFEKDGVRANSFKVSAKHVVVTTNTPINDWVTMHTKQHPYRTYVIGALIPKDALKPSLWWDTGDMNSKWVNDPYHYVRLEAYNDFYDLLIAGGEDHKTGQAESENIPEEQRYEKLIAWAKKHFPMMEEVRYRWSGQVMEPVDSMGFIGRNPGEKNVFIATGDSGNGITHGTIAGILISDLVSGQENRWEKLYAPSRITLKATGDFLKEVGNMAAQYLDLISPGDVKSVEQLQPQQGAIVNVGGLKKAAVYKDEQNVLHAYSAICPHMGCVLQWNGSEKSFDCPCHGSRFTCNGKVVNGPAQSDLKKINLKL